MDHLFEKLQSRASNGFVLCHGKIRELIVMTDMTSVGVAVLVGQPLVFAHIGVTRSDVAGLELLGR